MSVYVDDMCDYPMGQFGRMKMSHMVADTLDELHAMADQIGVARKWFQDTKTMNVSHDHYDIAKSKRNLAIKLGAKPITIRELAKMAKKPRGKKAKANPATASLLAALKFIEPASRDIGMIGQTHCALGGHWAVAFDGILAFAHKIDTDIIACPNTKRMLRALSKCDETTQITQLDDNRINIKSGKYQAMVPCVDHALLSILPPDPPQYAMGEAVRSSLEVVGRLVKENAPRMVQAAVLLRSGSAVATDGNIIFEHWHGFTNLPPVIVPKLFITELCKITKAPVSIGMSQLSCTVYFEDESWIRTQLYTEKYPSQIDTVLNKPASPMPILPEFWTALDKIDALKDDTERLVRFTERGLQTHESDQTGASYEFEGLPPGVVFNLDYLRMFQAHADQVDWHGDGDTMGIFYGPNFRGMLMHIKQRLAMPDAPYDPTYRNPHADDEIPF